MFLIKAELNDREVQLLFPAVCEESARSVVETSLRAANITSVEAYCE